MGFDDASAVQVDLAAGVTAVRGRQLVRAALGPEFGLSVQTARVRELHDRATTRDGLSRLTEIASLMLIAAALSMAAAMAGMVWQRRRRLADLKLAGIDHRQLWKALLLESVLLLGIGCGVGTVYGLYGEQLLNRALNAATGFPVDNSLGITVALLSLAVVLAVHHRRMVPGYLAARVTRRMASETDAASPRMPRWVAGGEGSDAGGGPAGNSARRRRGAGADMGDSERHARSAAVACGRPPGAAFSAARRRDADTQTRTAQHGGRVAVRHPAAAAEHRAATRARGVPDHPRLPRHDQRAAVRRSAGQRPSTASRLDGGGRSRWSDLDYYRLHPQREDVGYLRGLVEQSAPGALRCRHSSASGRVRRSAHLGTVQVPNHDPCEERRAAGLRAWVERELPGRSELSWFELTAAASSSLWTLALLALAADPNLHEDDVLEAETVYFPWINAASTLLDAFVDQRSDREEGGHSYVEHYDSPAEMVERLCEIVYRSVHGARQLRNGERHALIAAGMVSMYLSKESARSPELRPSHAPYRARGRLAAARAAADHARDARRTATRRRLTPSANYLRKGG